MVSKTKSRKLAKAETRKLRRKKSWCRLYALVDSENRVRYVGQTRYTLETRFSYHMSNARKWPKSRLANWLLREQRRIILIDDNATWDVSEILLIDKMKREGEDLLNVLRGGSDSLSAYDREIGNRERFKPTAPTMPEMHWVRGKSGTENDDWSEMDRWGD